MVSLESSGKQYSSEFCDDFKLVFHCPVVFRLSDVLPVEGDFVAFIDCTPAIGVERGNDPFRFTRTSVSQVHHESSLASCCTYKGSCGGAFVTTADNVIGMHREMIHESEQPPPASAEEGKDAAARVETLSEHLSSLSGEKASDAEFLNSTEIRRLLASKNIPFRD